MSAVVFMSVAAALFDVLLAVVWLATIGRVIERPPQGTIFPAWMRPSAIAAAALLAASAVSSLVHVADLAVWLRLAAAVAMLAGAAGLGLAYRRMPVSQAANDPAPPIAVPETSLSQAVADEPAPERQSDIVSLFRASPAAAEPASDIAASPAPSARISGDASQLQTIRLFESALAGSSITISQQNSDLRYTRIYNPLPGLPASVGGTDEGGPADDDLVEVRRLKLNVLENGEPVDTEVRLPFDGRHRWFKLRLEAAEDEPGGGLVCVAVDITAEKESEQHLRSVLRELTHRSRNLLAVIQGIARRTAASSDNVDGFVDRFGGRLQALAAAHDILIDSAWRGAPLRELVQVQLAQIGASGQQQLLVEGLPLTLKPEAAQHLSLALHELAVNAVEHGALSTPAGHVTLTWVKLEPPDHPADGIELVWREEGGPRVAEPERSGFGQIVLDRLVPRGLDGEASLEFLPEGVVWRLNFPRTNLLDQDAA